MGVHMARTAFFPVAAMLQGIAAAKGVFVGHLLGGLRSELIGKEDLARVKDRVLVIMTLLHQADQQRTGAVMQRGKSHVDHHGLPGLYIVAHVFADDFFNQCLFHIPYHPI